MTEDFKFGITTSFECNYLPKEKERLLVASDTRLHNSEHYAWLMSQGFRRSGEQIYRPHCLNCTACQSLRVIVDEFAPSRSQKRLLKKNQNFICKISEQVKDSYYPLYETYINTVHKDGSMCPANYQQFTSFINSDICEQIFIEIWHDNKLISVAVTDLLTNALSAVYTFYSPLYKNNALGIYSILEQIEIANELDKAYLYLGYQIDACSKMDYKDRYFPFEKLINNKWQLFTKAIKKQIK